MKATAAGCIAGETSFTVAEAQSTEATIKLEAEKTPEPVPAPVVVAPSPVIQPVALPAAAPAPAAEPKASPYKTAAIVSFSVAGAGLVVGAVTGIMAIDKHSTLEGECSNGCVTPESQDRLSTYHTLGTVSTIGFIVAGVGATTGIVALFAAPKAATSQSAWIRPTVGPMSIGAVGQF